MPLDAPRAVVGRERELELIRRVVTFDGDAPRALTVEGEAGMGKTTLWREGIAAAQAAGVVVRSAAAVESEASFAFAPLSDLLRGLASSVLEGMPRPLRQALEVALMLDEAQDEDLSAHAVAAGFLHVLRGLAAERPLVIAVDDCQWLDAASESVLAFAARRIEDVPIRLLVTRRVPVRGGAPVASFLAGEARLMLAPLTLKALQRLLLSRVTRLSDRAIRRIHEASGGNPLFALELATAVAEGGGSLGRLGELPVPETLVQALDARLEPLPRAGAQAVLAVALLAEPTAEAVDAALRDAEPLAVAERAGVVVREAGRVR
ncbi:MAG: AAA family ATPase, partial [Solirubrobacteraceae bacterium]